ncbi:MAG: MBL fold metallo-hydrolase [Proteobacteria bacterium]|nr:MAG: MBL fold metallo-hydrolase [Pseudomonadota bacterium]
MSESVEITILGCGTSTGVPLLQCRCPVCTSRNRKNRRLRASAWLKTRGKSFLIDTSSDLREQALRENIDRVDAILYTHPHSDHVAGIDDVRAFNFLQKMRIPAYGNAWTHRDLTSRYPYIFTPQGLPEGGGIPEIDFNLIPDGTKSIEVQGVKFETLSVKHGSQDVLAYRVENVAYLTDCNHVPEEAAERLHGLEVLILDCLRLTKHGTHFHLDEALEFITKIKPRKTILTHLSHDFDYEEWTKRGSDAKLPRNVTLAYDGMCIRVAGKD